MEDMSISEGLPGERLTIQFLWHNTIPLPLSDIPSKSPNSSRRGHYIYSLGVRQSQPQAKFPNRSEEATAVENGQ